MHPITVEREAIAARIRLLVALLVVANVIVLILQVLAGSPGDLFAGIVLVSVNLVLLACTYALRRSRYGPALVFIDLTVIALALAVAGPLSGTIDGSLWTLFQLPPLIATIVLNQRRTMLSLVAISGVLVTAVGLLTLGGAFSATLIVPRDSLWNNLGAQLITLTLVAVTISLMELRAERALSQVQASEGQVQQQLQRERELVGAQERLNAELNQRLKEIQARDEIVAQQESEQQHLRAMISGLAAPVIPVLAGVVVMPLIGDFDANRSEQLSVALLEGVTTHRAQVAVLDVTGVEVMDQAVAQALLRATDACKLLGTTPILVGVSPEAAQTLTGLNVDLRTLRTSANLQAGVEEAMRLISSRQRRS